MKKKTLTTILLTATMFLFPSKAEHAQVNNVLDIKGSDINTTIQSTYEETVSYKNLSFADIAFAEELEVVEEEVVIVEMYYTTTHSLNKRKTSNIKYAPIGWLGKGQPVIGIQTLNNGWVELSDGSFVNGKYLKQQTWTSQEYEANVVKYNKMVKEQAAQAKLQAAQKKTQITESKSSNAKTSYTTRHAITISSADRDLIARLVRAEAGGESYEGMVAVASVVFNRMASKKFPDTAKAVIYAKNQFVPAASGSINKSASDVHYKAVDDALTRDNTSGALFFYNAKTAKSRWLDGLQTVAVIGSHTFKVN